MLRVGKSKLKALAAAATLAAPAISMAQVSNTWTFNGPQTWSVTLNWNGNANVPNAGGTAVLPATALTTDQVASINLDSNRTLGRVDITGNFLGARSYAITGTSSLTLNADTTVNVDSGVHRINTPTVVAGLLTKTGAGTIVLGGANTFTANVGVLAINEGVLQAAAANSLRGITAAATANGAALELNSVGTVGSLVFGLGAIGAPNGTLRVIGGTNNVMSGILSIVQTGTINVGTGFALSYNGTVFDSDQGGLNGLNKVGTGTLNYQSSGLGMALQGPYNQVAGATNMIGNGTMSTLNITGGTFSLGLGSLAVANTVNLNAGAYNINGGGTHNGNITVGGGTLQITGGRVNSIVAVNSGTALFSGATMGTLNVNGGTARLVQQSTANAAVGVTRVAELNIAGGQKFDVTNNSMIIDYTGASPQTTIKTLLKSGRGGGTWNGNGLITSLGGTIGAGSFTGKKAGVGYSEQTALPGAPLVFKGQAIDATTLLTKYTLHGDADLDGDVDLDDVIRWSANFTSELGGTGPKFWSQGDWDYDGDVDLDDVILWSGNFTSELGGAGFSEPLDLGASFAAADPGALAALESIGYSVVPEPATFGAVIMAAGAALVGRRRRRVM